MTTISPYLSFAGNCAEAMLFYKECLGGELTLQVIRDSPMAAQWPAHMQDAVLHAMLANGPLVLLATDVNDPTGAPLTEGNSVSLSLNCATREEMNVFFEKLSAGGNAIRAPHDFFAGAIAVLQDKFHKHWILYHGNQ